MYDTPIGMCKTHQKYRCARYTLNGVQAGTNVAHHIWCVGHTLFFTVYKGLTKKVLQKQISDLTDIGPIACNQYFN